MSRAKKRLLKLVRHLLKKPEDGSFYRVEDEIIEPEAALRTKTPKAKLYFRTDRLLRFFEGVLNFPDDYIPIRENVPFDKVVISRPAKDSSKEPKAVEVFDSPIHGKGLRIQENVEKKTFIIEYLGELISTEEENRRASDHDGKGYSYTRKFSDKIALDAYYFGNKARFLNHSCDPNCKTGFYHKKNFKHLGIFSLKSIDANQELTIDYKWSDVRFKAMKCNCRAEICRNQGQDEAQNEDQGEDQHGDQLIAQPQAQAQEQEQEQEQAQAQAQPQARARAGVQMPQTKGMITRSKAKLMKMLKEQAEAQNEDQGENQNEDQLIAQPQAQAQEQAVPQTKGMITRSKEKLMKRLKEQDQP